MTILCSVTGFGDYRLMTDLNVKTLVTTNFRNITTEERIKTEVTSILVKYLT